jgi:Restriction endonuclease
MRLHVFGTTSDDKGTQLEQLTSRLLRRLGYRDIATNVVGAGGSEVDVRAELQLPSIHVSDRIHLMAECKASDAPIVLSDWLKFLGKVYTERARGSGQVRGILIALSGANGNAAGAVAEFNNADTTVELITGDRLADIVVQEFGMPGIQQALAHISQLTTDPVIEISIGYYDGLAFWVAEFAGSSYTVLSGTLGDAPSETVGAVVQAHFKTARHRDLRQEELGRSRLRIARKYVLGKALGGQGRAVLRKDVLPDQSLGIGELDVQEAITSLSDSGILESRRGEVAIKDIDNDLARRIEVVRILIDERLLVSVFGSPGLVGLIDDALLDAVLQIQGGLQIPPEIRAECIQLIKWSPTALLWAVTPDPMLVVHRREGVPPHSMTDSDDNRYFRLQLLRYAATDFQNPILASAYFEKFGLRELEFSRRATFKSAEGAELSVDIPERLGIGRLAPTLGGGVIHVWLTEQAPEPWRWPVVAPVRDPSDPVGPTDVPL